MNIQHIDEHYIPFARVLPLLKEVARGNLYWDGDDEKFCPFCDYSQWNGQKVHNQDCPVVLARCILKEQGIPLRLYTISFEQRWAYNLHGWFTNKNDVIAYTEEEALTNYKEDPDPDDIRNSKRRNIQVIAHREIEENEAEP